MPDKADRGTTTYAGNALYASVPVQHGEIIGTFDRIISAHAVLSDSVLQERLKSMDFESLPALNEKLILTLYLAIHCPVERTDQDKEDHESNFRDVIEMLPVPIQVGVWREDDQDLKRTQIFPAIQAKRRLLQTQWSALAPRNCTFETWKWADSIISSRSIGLSDARIESADSPMSSMAHDWTTVYNTDESTRMFSLPPEPNLVIVPVMDLCNHAGKERNARWELDQTSGSILLLAGRDIATGEEVTISYGDEKANEELLFNYNFTLPRNPNWSLTLTLPVPRDLSPPDAREDGRDYWHAVRERFGLLKVIRLTRAGPGIATHAETSGTSRFMAHWKAMDPLGLEAGQVAAILLSSSATVMNDGTLPLLFSEEESDDDDDDKASESAISQWTERVLAHLRDIVLDKQTNAIEARNQVGAKSVAYLLLSDEIRGCQAVLTSLGHGG